MGRLFSGLASGRLNMRTSLQNVLTLASEIREHSQSVGLVIFSYLNPILRMGLAKFLPGGATGGSLTEPADFTGCFLSKKRA